MADPQGVRITRGKGFHITFDNGWTVSVQFGPGNYCENYDAQIGIDEEACGARGSHDAEVAMWAPDGELRRFSESGDTVIGRQSPNQILAIMQAASEGRTL